MIPVTTEEVKEAVRQKYGTNFIPLRKCSLCNETIGYYQQEDDKLWFEPSCGCGGGKGRYETFEYLAQHVNMQDNIKGHNYMRRTFGLPEV